MDRTPMYDLIEVPKDTYKYGAQNETYIED